MSTANIIEKLSDADDTNRMDKNDPNTKTEYSKSDSQQCNVEKEVIESENGKIEVEVLKGQESFRIKSLTKSNNWAFFKSGKINFKKGELIECFKPLEIV